MVDRTQWFADVEAIYKARFHAFVALAKRSLYNRDLAIDAVHDALAKSLSYSDKHPEMNISEQVVNTLIKRACKRLNKRGPEVIVDVDLIPNVQD